MTEKTHDPREGLNVRGRQVDTSPCSNLAQVFKINIRLSIFIIQHSDSALSTSSVQSMELGKNSVQLSRVFTTQSLRCEDVRFVYQSRFPKCCWRKHRDPGQTRRRQHSPRREIFRQKKLR